MNNLPIILGVDPGTRFMGMAVIQGKRLLAYGVHTLTNGTRPYDVIGQARKVFLSYVERHNPAIFALEEPLRILTQTASILSVIDQELGERGKEVSLTVMRLSPPEIRTQLLGNPRATKLEVARKLVELGYHDLALKVPRAPRRAVLGYDPKDRYWLHAFDALAVAEVAKRRLTP